MVWHITESLPWISSAYKSTKKTLMAKCQVPRSRPGRIHIMDCKRTFSCWSWCEWGRVQRQEVLPPGVSSPGTTTTTTTPKYHHHCRCCHPRLPSVWLVGIIQHVRTTTPIKIIHTVQEPQQQELRRRQMVAIHTKTIHLRIIVTDTPKHSK